MGKFYEKKNFGIPVTILIVFAYLIGYSLSNYLSSSLLAALLFALAVFSFDFDDRVKNAVKTSYIVAILFQLIDFALQIIGLVINLIFGGAIEYRDISYILQFFSRGMLRNIPGFLYAFLLFAADAAVIVIFAVFIILTLLGKDVNIGIISNIMGEGPKKDKDARPPFSQQNNNRPNYYNPPVPPVPPAGYNNQAPVPPVPPAGYSNQAPAQPQNPQAPGQTKNSNSPEQAHNPQDPKEAQDSLNVQGEVCPNCGKVNKTEAIYCTACGTKLK